MRIPIELLLNLSKFLSIRDRIRLRCVCKEWRSFIDEFCLDELVLFIRVHPTLELWSHNSKAIEFRNLIFSQSDRWHSDANGFKFVFRNVKRLFLCIRNQEDAAYRLDFSKLENLELRRFSEKIPKVYKWREDYFRIAFELNLKSLRTFHVNYLDEGLQLNFPKIYFFSFDCVYPCHPFGESNFKYPIQHEQITHLRCERYPEWAQKLKNLKVLFCKSYGYGEPVNFLACHQKLECLHFNYCFPECIDPILNEAQKLNRVKGLEFYVLSYVPDGRLVDGVYRWAGWMTWQKAEYYKVDLARLAPTIPFISCLVYENSNGSFNGLDAAFYAKLVDLRNVKIRVGSSSQEQLIELIKHFKNIVRILLCDFNDENLDEFNALLPQHCPYLRTLNVDNRSLSAFFDLRFAFKLPELYSFNFTRPSKLRCHRLDYLFLRLKLQLKREQIRMINGELTFEQDSACLW